MMCTCEIWGAQLNKIDKLNSIYATFCKKVLNLPLNSANIAAGLEFKTNSLEGQVLARSVKYIMSKIQNPNLSIIYYICLNQKNLTSLEFFNNIKNSLNNIGLGYIWNQLDTANINYVVKTIKNKYNDINKQISWSKLPNFKSLCFYEKYIKYGQNFIYNDKLRRIKIEGLAWFRLGIWILKFQRGNIPINQCPLCKLFEDDHILFKCSITQKLRIKLIDRKY